ncbi:MAG: PhzF family phenazine biosynthesis protein [Cytophagaceae bacterium]|nr:PhzF family phenazine biosynthesis protein [Cytophagaceae bacterium]
MTLNIYQADAFTDQLFKGNPAAICPLDAWLPRETMLAIAAENNLAETAFFVKNGADFDLKWFTPTVEVDLCGHATLATAKILFDVLGYAEDLIRFHTNSGLLTVRRDSDLLTLDFPADPPELISPTFQEELTAALGIAPVAVYTGKTDLLVLLDSQQQVESLQPDFRLLSQINVRGVIVTAPGDDANDAPVDFVSRFFGPQSGIDEDPVTGSAHTTLTPFWAEKLGKTSLTARQISPRGGDLWLKLLGDRVEISGKAVVYLVGEIFV